MYSRKCVLSQNGTVLRWTTKQEEDLKVYSRKRGEGIAHQVEQLDQPPAEQQGSTDVISISAGIRLKGQWPQYELSSLLLVLVSCHMLESTNDFPLKSSNIFSLMLIYMSP